MEQFVQVVLHAGRGALDVALYTLLPVMVAMSIAMRMLEVSGALARVVNWIAPVARPFGLTGLGVLAMIQISFISFVAPLPTLGLMEDRGASDRQLAAALAAVLAMAPANAVFPLTALGLRGGEVLMLSALGGVVAAASTYWVVGRRLSSTPRPARQADAVMPDKPSLLAIINVSGKEAIQLVIDIIPMLLMSLLVVIGLERAGAVEALITLIAPALNTLGVDHRLVLPAITKYLAGSTALVGLVSELSKQGGIAPSTLNGASGLLLHPLDLPGVAIFISAGKRTGACCTHAIAGAVVGIALRTAGGMMLA